MLSISERETYVQMVHRVYTYFQIFEPFVLNSEEYRAVQGLEKIYTYANTFLGKFKSIYRYILLVKCVQLYLLSKCKTQDLFRNLGVAHVQGGAIADRI